MIRSTNNSWLHRFARLTALATLGLIGIGGLVTSHGVGMSVPDWPTSYGYNMFVLPISLWFTGGVFHEHTHRLWATAVGVLVVALMRWLGGSESRRPLMIIGGIEIVAGQLLLLLGTDWKGAGHFLSGIGGVVLLAGIVWVKNAPASRPLPALGWAVFWLVQIQGLLGGLRVVLDGQRLADMRLGTAFGIVHGCLAQAFLVLTFVIVLFTSRWWRNWSADALVRSRKFSGLPKLRHLFIIGTALIFLQLILGATMRHQHAGLAIPDFPLAYGKLWPATDANSVMRYNQQRVEVLVGNSITAPQIFLQMGHRIMALAILVCVGLATWRAKNWRPGFGEERDENDNPSRGLQRFAYVWLGLILVQVCLGAWTIWSNKAADVATAHVVVGALSLVVGSLGWIACNQLTTETEAARRSGISRAPVGFETAHSIAGTACSPPLSHSQSFGKSAEARPFHNPSRPHCA